MASVTPRNRPKSEPEKPRNRPQAAPPRGGENSPRPCKSAAPPPRRAPADRAPADRAARQTAVPDTAIVPQPGAGAISNRAPQPDLQTERPVPGTHAEQANIGGSSGTVGNSATVGAQLWLPESPWRVTAGWTVLAALLAYGLLARSFFVDWRLIALALLLADPLWGSIWRLAGGRHALLPINRQINTRPFWLPYLRPDSPAAQLLGWDTARTARAGNTSGRDTSGRDTSGRDTPGRDLSVVPLVFRVALPTLILPLAIAWVLGAQALWLTAGIIVLSVLGWLGRHFLPTPPGIFQSLVTVTLPWILTLGILNLSRDHEHFALHIALVILWTLHHWGEIRVARGDWRNGPAGDRLGLGLLAFADLGMGALLIVAQTPLWLAPLAILWLPTYLTLYQGKSVQRLPFWWLAALLLSSAAIGSRMI